MVGFGGIGMDSGMDSVGFKFGPGGDGGVRLGLRVLGFELN